MWWIIQRSQLFKAGDMYHIRQEMHSTEPVHTGSDDALLASWQTAAFLIREVILTNIICAHSFKNIIYHWPLFIFFSKVRSHVLHLKWWDFNSSALFDGCFWILNSDQWRLSVFFKYITDYFQTYLRWKFPIWLHCLTVDDYITANLYSR